MTNPEGRLSTDCALNGHDFRRKHFNLGATPAESFVAFLHCYSPPPPRPGQSCRSGRGFFRAPFRLGLGGLGGFAFFRPLRLVRPPGIGLGEVVRLVRFPTGDNRPRLCLFRCCHLLAADDGFRVPDSQGFRLFWRLSSGGIAPVCPGSPKPPR